MGKQATTSAHSGFLLVLLLLLKLCYAFDSSIVVGRSRVADVDVSSNSGIFPTLASAVAHVMIESDNKRETTGYDGASTGWTSWVDQESAAHLSTMMAQTQLLEDKTSTWIRWLQSCPTPVVVEWSAQLRASVMEQLSKLYVQDSTSETKRGSPPPDEHLAITERIGMRLIHLPSGCCLNEPLTAPPGAMVYGLAMVGGITRFRWIGSASSRRRAGERTVIVGDDDEDLSWLQYGGPSRNYQAVDMGPGMLLELLLLPSGLELPLLGSCDTSSNVLLSSVGWHPQDVLTLKPDIALQTDASEEGATVDDHINVGDLETAFSTTLGGLQPQIDEIIRRVLDGRVFKGATEDSATDSALDQIRREEMVTLLELGLQPVRGLLLYGQPGCGKTLLAREISNILNARPPKIVAAPDLLDRWVGGTESMVRMLFEDAENELYQTCNGDATRSGLHVIVVDEIDAVFRKRSAAESTSEVTRASAVNQILAKLDGVNALDNILFIGMTNRKELLDPALLRPGRLEVQIEIPLPTEEGRREILNILFRELRKRGRLSQNLCQAIDGLKSARPRIADLAGKKNTGGFSGADLAGLVRNAGSIALDRCRKQEQGDISYLLITLEDTMKALQEIKETKVLT